MARDDVCRNHVADGGIISCPLRRANSIVQYLEGRNMNYFEPVHPAIEKAVLGLGVFTSPQKSSFRHLSPLSRFPLPDPTADANV
jgi:hypothetical protein